MNRVSAAIRRMQQQISERIAMGLTTVARVEATRKALDMDLGEFARFQELKSIACLDGTLTEREATYVFGLLGSTPGVFNSRDAATKAVLTQLYRELLERQVSRA